MNYELLIMNYFTMTLLFYPRQSFTLLSDDNIATVNDHELFFSFIIHNS